MRERGTQTVSRRRLLGATAAAVVGGAGWLRWHRFTVETTSHDVVLPGLPASADGLRVVQLSDLHLSPWVPAEYLAECVERANALAPDLVAVTGDFIQTAASLAEPCAELLAELRAPQGVWGVLGNHDHWTDAERVTRALTAVGVELLRNRSERLACGLAIGGLDDYVVANGDYSRASGAIPAEECFLLLSHNPQVINEAAARPCLVLAGHTHGGQVALPLLPRVLPPDMAGTGLVAGWYRRGAAQLYINRGLGMVQPAVRFRCPPELTVFTLRAGAG